MIREKLREMQKYDPDSDIGYLAPVRKICYNLFWSVLCAVYLGGIMIFFVLGLGAVYGLCSVMMVIDKIRKAFGHEPKY